MIPRVVLSVELVSTKHGWRIESSHNPIRETDAIEKSLAEAAARNATEHFTALAQHLERCARDKVAF